MKRAYLKLTLNTVIFSGASFFIFFVIFYYFMPKSGAIGVSVTLSLLLALIIIKINLVSDKKARAKADREKRFSELFTELAFTPTDELVDTFHKAYSNLGVACEKRGDKLYLTDKRKTIFFAFGFDGLTKSDIVKAYNKIPLGERAAIFTSDCSAEVKEFAERFGGRIKVVRGEEIFKLLEDGEAMPEIRHRLIDLSQKKKLDFKAFLDRKKAKRFLALGFAFLFFSFFVPIKVYYIVCGTVLSVFSLFVLFFVKPERKEN